MVDLGFRKPTNGVVQGDTLGPEFLKVGANATAAKMLPGIAVCKDTNDFCVKEADASANDIGFLGYEYSPSKPATIDTAYAVGDIAAVHCGAGRRQMGRLTTNQTIVKGQPLKVTTDGYLAAATVGTNDVVGDAAESVTTTSSTADIWITTRK